jgi:hypothetical protein
MNHTAHTLTGMNTTQLEQLRRQINLDFFAPETTDTMRDELCKVHDIVSNCLPHSFVLASLFDVEAMTLDIPDHILESDLGLEYVCCPSCDGEKWLETNHNGWVSALFSHPARAYAHRYLNNSYKACGRCNGSGEVLDLATPTEDCHDEVTSVQPTPNTHYLIPAQSPVLAMAA